MKTKFNYTEHDQAALNLQNIRDYLSSLSADISNAYGSSSKVSKLAREASDLTDELRFALADELHKEAPVELQVEALDFYQRQNK
ncbi:hypothetical protein [Aliivibrio fischeri]|uniref:hypothetical protein n=1 Tax=Aliivibrio fischeri TaxID=668 RepID=UPI0007C4D39B|nr:hypothetical protein [Aliivibrio fischeri]